MTLSLICGSLVNRTSYLSFPGDIRDCAGSRSPMWSSARAYGVFTLHDSKRESRTGNRTVMRHVPVHRNLLRLGWLDYVESRRPAGSPAWLFPDLATNQYGKRGAVFSNWFNEYLRSPIGIVDRAVVYHSYRHTFQSFGELSGISGQVIDELIGHAPDSRYGRKEGGFKRLPFELLVQAMERLDFPGLKLGHLPRAEPA